MGLFFGPHKHQAGLHAEFDEGMNKGKNGFYFGPTKKEFLIMVILRIKN